MRALLTLLLTAAMILPAVGQPGGPCEAPPYHEFDFVVGNWLVRDREGGAVATVTFSKAYRGCVMIERWIGAGRVGESLGLVGYQSDSDRWHRDFLAPNGGVISLEGGREGPRMVMTGNEYPPEGVRKHRISWTPTRTGTVMERWELSADDGRTWQVRSDREFHRISE